MAYKETFSNEEILEKGYSNSCVSEYITCNIMKILGLNVQSTILGKYSLNGTQKLALELDLLMNALRAWHMIG